MKKVVDIIGYIFLSLAFVFSIIHFFVIKSDGVITTDLWGLVIPEPPVWTSYIPGAGYFGDFFEMLSLHGIIGTTVFLFLGGIGYFLVNFKEKKSSEIPSIELQKKIIDMQEKEKFKRSLTGQMEYSKNGNPIIFGVELEKENFPELYKWAQINPSRLIDQVRNVANKWHDGNYTSAIIALEVDLSHQ
ncbi:MAG: hypothetical protein PF572_04205 [Patescibacteria group bacterium]|jgi:hypothetical protein|nr:hypothetical protein [Patescibacteria group bacterium]